MLGIKDKVKESYCVTQFSKLTLSDCFSENNNLLEDIEIKMLNENTIVSTLIMISQSLR